MQERSFLVQVLLDMATGGGAKLEPLLVDKAGVFDAGLNKGYNPVTVPSGDTSVVAEKSVVTNHAIVITPEASVIAGWQDGKSVTGEGIGVSASELVSGTYSVSETGIADVTNYQNISVKSGGTTASIDKVTIDEHTVRFTPKATVAQGWQDSSTVSGNSVDVNAGELVSGTYPVTASGEFDVSAYEKISVPSGVVSASATKGIVAGHTVTVTPMASRSAGFISSGETEGLGVNVTASELVSGTLNVSQSGTQDVTNYESISVPNGGHSASATKGAVSNHSLTVTPKSIATLGFVTAGTVNGNGIVVSANELVSGELIITQSGSYDATNYKTVTCNIAPGYKFAYGAVDLMRQQLYIKFTINDKINNVRALLLSSWTGINPTFKILCVTIPEPPNGYLVTYGGYTRNVDLSVIDTNAGTIDIGPNDATYYYADRYRYLVVYD